MVEQWSFDEMSADGKEVSLENEVGDRLVLEVVSDDDEGLTGVARVRNGILYCSFADGLVRSIAVPDEVWRRWRELQLET